MLLLSQSGVGRSQTRIPPLPEINILKMRAARKITLVDTMYGADLCARATARAKRIVDNGKVVLNLYSAVRTSFLALHTANATVRAVFARKRALVVIGAFYYYVRRIVDQLDDVIGAGTDANSTAYTF